MWFIANPRPFKEAGAHLGVIISRISFTSFLRFSYNTAACDVITGKIPPTQTAASNTKKFIFVYSHKQGVVWENTATNKYPTISRITT